MWEISENLHRAELTVVQRSEQVSRWAELADRISAQVEQKIGRGRPESGVAKAARDLNLDRTEVQRAVKIAALTPEAKAVATERGAAFSGRFRQEHQATMGLHEAYEMVVDFFDCELGKELLEDVGNSLQVHRMGNVGR